MLKIFILLLMVMNSALLYSGEVVIKWNKVKWAINYKLQIAEDIDFYDIVGEYNKINDISLKINLEDGIYYFKVAGISEKGVPGLYSKPERFVAGDEEKLLLLQQNKKNITKKGETPGPVIVPIGTSYKLQLTDNNTGKIFYSLNSTNFIEYEPDKLITMDKDGLQKISYYGVDTVENKAPVKRSLIRVDGTPPHVKINISGKKYFSKGLYYVKPDAEISFSASDTVSTIGNIFAALNSDNFTNYKDFSIKMEELKTNVIKYYAVDSVGNKSIISQAMIIADSTPPVIDYSFEGPFISRGDNVFIIGKDTKIKVSASDHIPDMLEIKIGKNKNFSYESPFSIEKPEDTVKISAGDKLNNKSEIELKIIRDDAPPVNRLKTE